MLRARGVEVRTQTSLGQVTSGGLRLTDGEFVATRTIVWSYGVRPDPLVSNLGLAAEQGRIRVDEYLAGRFDGALPVLGHRVPARVRLLYDVLGVRVASADGSSCWRHARSLSGFMTIQTYRQGSARPAPRR